MGDAFTQRYQKSGFLTNGWSELNQAVGGDLYTDPEKLGSMRLVAGRPEFSNEGHDGTLSGGFKQAVLDQIQKISGLSVEERQHLRALGDNPMVVRSDPEKGVVSSGRQNVMFVPSDEAKDVGRVNALINEHFKLIDALSNTHDAGSEPA